MHRVRQLLTIALLVGSTNASFAEHSRHPAEPGDYRALVAASSRQSNVPRAAVDTMDEDVRSTATGGPSGGIN